MPLVEGEGKEIHGAIMTGKHASADHAGVACVARQVTPMGVYRITDGLNISFNSSRTLGIRCDGTSYHILMMCHYFNIVCQFSMIIAAPLIVVEVRGVFGGNDRRS